jgi:mannitol-specific phosphotransferase system IIBC component
VPNRYVQSLAGPFIQDLLPLIAGVGVATAELVADAATGVMRAGAISRR